MRKMAQIFVVFSEKLNFNTEPFRLWSRIGSRVKISHYMQPSNLSSALQEGKQSIKSFWVNDSGLHLRTHLFSKGYRLLARIGGFLQTKMKGNSPWQLCGWIFQQMKWHGCIIGTIHIFTYDIKNEKKVTNWTLTKKIF